MPFTPSNEQEAFLRHTPGQHARILAGPGTGKSATLIEWLIRHESIRAKLLTFTRAATAELATTLTTHNDIVFDRPSTIHSYCIAVLLRNPNVGGFPRPFRMADDWEFDEVVLSTLGRRLHIDKRQVEYLFKELAANWESLAPDENERVDAPTRARFMGAWAEHRRILGYTLLSELPYALRAALTEHLVLDGIDHEILIVDEYQDLNACDLEVLRLISTRGTSIIAAGDDDQSIYSFRKAHPEGIRRFLVDYSGACNYPLTITRRCAKMIVDWANYVIQGDPDRAPDRGSLNSAAEAPVGEVALLGFAGNSSEAKGVAKLVQHLMTNKGVAASEILILLRSDHNGQFSSPIKNALRVLDIPYTDPSEATALLADSTNRHVINLLRLAVRNDDSLAWASVLHLATGVGPRFFDYIYDRARNARLTFGRALLASYAAGFPELTTAVARRANNVIASTQVAVASFNVPAECPDNGWGNFIIQQCESASMPLSVEFKTRACPTRS